MNNTDVMANILGTGIGGSILFFPLSYLALSRQFKFRFSNTKIAILFGLTAISIGILRFLIESAIGKGGQDYTGIFNSLILPPIVSGVVIFIAYKKSL